MRVQALGHAGDVEAPILYEVHHAMWFHRPFRADRWLLYCMESPNASGSRGLATGRFYDENGKLVASTAQEGLIRIWPQAGE